MQLGAGRREQDFEINVIPLIDVLLTLLMFFVLTTTFVRQSALKVQLPSATATTTVAQTRPLVILVDRSGHFYIDNHPVLGHTEDALKRAIIATVGKDRDRQVALRADARTTHQAVVTAMDALGQLGFTHLAMATIHGQAGSGH